MPHNTRELDENVNLGHVQQCVVRGRARRGRQSEFAGSETPISIQWILWTVYHLGVTSYFFAYRSSAAVSFLPRSLSSCSCVGPVIRLISVAYAYGFSRIAIWCWMSWICRLVCVGIVPIKALSNLPALLVHRFKSSLVIVFDEN